MRLSLITPTGGRREAFALSERWFAQQTILKRPDFKGEIEWLVVDDVEPSTPTYMGQEYLRPASLWKTGANTQYQNLCLALRAATGDVIVPWEDDDYYGAQYLEQVWNQSQLAPLIGETPSRYFNVRKRSFRTFTNGASNKSACHAGFCQTAFHRELIPKLLPLWSPGCYPDIALWKHKERLGGMLYSGTQVVGMKGMPGRTGISRAHQSLGVGWYGDVSLTRLRQWIGQDAEFYREYGKS